MCIRDSDYRPDPGLNVFCGENECGKTTILQFLRLIFYPYSFSGSDPQKNPRKKYKPFSGAKMSCFVVFLWKGERIRMERSFGASPATDQSRIFDGAGGEISLPARTNPGEYFLEMNLASFEKVCFIGQLASIQPGAEEQIGRRLAALALTGDASVSPEEAVGRLDRALLLYRTPRRVGCLDREEDALQEQKRRLAEAVRLEAERAEDASALRDLAARMEKRQSQLAELEEKEQKLRLRREIDRLEKLMSRIEEAEREKQTLEKAKLRLCRGGVPMDPLLPGQILAAHTQWQTQAGLLAAAKAARSAARIRCRATEDPSGTEDAEWNRLSAQLREAEASLQQIRASAAQTEKDDEGVRARLQQAAAEQLTAQTEWQQAAARAEAEAQRRQTEREKQEIQRRRRVQKQRWGLVCSGLLLLGGGLILLWLRQIWGIALAVCGLALCIGGGRIGRNGGSKNGEPDVSDGGISEELEVCRARMEAASQRLEECRREAIRSERARSEASEAENTAMQAAERCRARLESEESSRRREAERADMAVGEAERACAAARERLLTLAGAWVPVETPEQALDAAEELRRIGEEIAREEDKAALLQRALAKEDCAGAAERLAKLQAQWNETTGSAELLSSMDPAEEASCAAALAKLRDLQEKDAEAHAALDKHLALRGKGMPEVAVTEREIDRLTKRCAAMEETCQALSLAREVMEQCGRELRGEVSPVLNRKAAAYLAEITGKRYTDMTVSPALTPSVREKETSASSVDWMYLSGGTADAAYFSLRLALAELITGEEPLPLLLDDPFVQYDTKRRAAAEDVLKRLGASRQILLFTCRM